MSNYYSLLIGGAFLLVVFVSTVFAMRSRARTLKTLSDSAASAQFKKPAPDQQLSLQR